MYKRKNNLGYVPLWERKTCVLIKLWKTIVEEEAERKDIDTEGWIALWIFLVGLIVLILTPVIWAVFNG